MYSTINTMITMTLPLIPHVFFNNRTNILKAKKKKVPLKKKKVRERCGLLYYLLRIFVIQDVSVLLYKQKNSCR